MKTSAVLFAVALAACASSGATGGSTAPQTVRVMGAGGATITLATTDASHSHTIAFSPDQVFRMIPSVLDSLGIPVTMLEPGKRSVGNPSLKVRQRLKTTPLSRYIDCGTSTQIGANADNYDVNLSIIADVRPGQGNSAEVTFNVEAAARPLNFAQDYAACRSRGLLESRFFETLNGRLAGAPSKGN